MQEVITNILLSKCKQLITCAFEFMDNYVIPLMWLVMVVNIKCMVGTYVTVGMHVSDLGGLNN